MVDKYTVVARLDDFLEKLIQVPKDDVDVLFRSLASGPNPLYDCTRMRWIGLPLETSDKAQQDSGEQKFGVSSRNKSGPSRSTSSIGVSRQSSPAISANVSHSTPVDSAGSPEDRGSKLIEREMYAPFIKIANEINSLVKANTRLMSELNGAWVDCSSHVPKSLGPTEDRRPDMVFISSGSDETELEENTKAKYSASENQKNTDSLDRVWWSQMFTVAELKRASKDKYTAFVQLACYVRQVFKAQLDRRFVLATTLCGGLFNVYLFDRSGIVATDPINIHEEPEQFIRVLASFSYLSPERLGWDSTMKVYQNPNRVIPSYQVQWKKLSKQSKYDLQWVITHIQEQWISLETLSLVHSEMLVGRATLVFRVVKWEAFIEGKKDADAYVMKQTWQRLPGLDNDCAKALRISDNVGAQPLHRHPSPFNEIPFEAHVLAKAGIQSERILSCECVQDNKVVVDTLHWIRGNILVEVPDEEPSRQQVIKFAAQLPEGREQFLTPHYTSVRSESTLASRQSRRKGYGGFDNLVCRTQTRNLLKDFGWPIKYFRDLRELLRVIADAIKDHESLFRRGVLHRDVSPGNILIKTTRGSSEIQSGINQTKGLLIDFDHSKVADQTRILKEKDLTDEDKEDLSSLVQELSIEEEAVVHHASIFGTFHIHSTLSTARDFHELKPRGRRLTLEDFGWHNTPDRIPLFNANTPGKGERTGTVEFMSHQLLVEHGRPCHEAIHDLESFWWVLLYIAIAYEGPGAEPVKPTPERMDCLREFFEEENWAELGLSKATLFVTSDVVSSRKVLEDKILPRINPYFEPMRPLLMKWWALLFFAFQNKNTLDFLYPYGSTLKLFSDFLAREIKSTREDLTKKEDIHRFIDDAKIEAAIHLNTCVSLLEDPISYAGSGQITFSNKLSPAERYYLNIPAKLQPLSIGSIRDSMRKASRNTHRSKRTERDRSPTGHGSDEPKPPKVAKRK